jgi:uncharacterized membrane protein
MTGIDADSAVPARGLGLWLRSSWDLLLALLAGGLLALVLYFVDWAPEWLGPLRVVLGLAYVFAVPGYALQAALFPRPADLDRAARFALATGLSVAVLPPLVLVLDWLPWGIRTWPALIGLNAITLVCVLIAMLRRAGPGTREAVDLPPLVPERQRLGAWWSGLRPPARRLYVAMTVTLLVALGSAAALVILPQPDAYFTEFYILGAQGLVADYPREVVAGQPFEVRTGIRNLEGVDMRYRVEVTSFDQVVGKTGEFSIPAGQVVEGPFSIALPIPGDDVPVIFHLYRSGQAEPYRTLRLWIKVRPAP